MKKTRSKKSHDTVPLNVMLRYEKSEKLSIPTSGCLNSKNVKAENKFFSMFLKK
jgi:hypothetical protein